MSIPKPADATNHLRAAQHFIEKAWRDGVWTDKQRRLITDTHRQMNDYIRIQEARKAERELSK